MHCLLAGFTRAMIFSIEMVERCDFRSIIVLQGNRAITPELTLRIVIIDVPMLDDVFPGYVFSGTII